MEVRLLGLLGVCARPITREVGLLLRSGSMVPLAERPPGDRGAGGLGQREGAVVEG